MCFCLWAFVVCCLSLAFVFDDVCVCVFVLCVVCSMCVFDVSALDMFFCVSNPDLVVSFGCFCCLHLFCV